jgi:hypothetical protein
VRSLRLSEALVLQTSRQLSSDRSLLWVWFWLRWLERHFPNRFGVTYYETAGLSRLGNNLGTWEYGNLLGDPSWQRRRSNSKQPKSSTKQCHYPICHPGTVKQQEDAPPPKTPTAPPAAAAATSTNFGNESIPSETSRTFNIGHKDIGHECARN